MIRGVLKHDVTEADRLPILRGCNEVLSALRERIEQNNLPPDAKTSGARAYVNKETLGAKTLRRLWDQRDEVDFAS